MTTFCLHPAGARAAGICLLPPLGKFMSGFCRNTVDRQYYSFYNIANQTSEVIRLGFQIGGAILDFVVLSILNNRDAYGYQLTQEVRSILDVSETALYPALRRMQKNGLLDTYDVPYQGRNRRYYRLTDSGRQSLADYTDQWRVFRQSMDHLLKEETKDDC